ncbi:2-methylaconitate cis-trans isomerase PrpF family protein [Enterococcus sp. HY326]|uniref:2-methylaconitate cis-trans isomerase PrpF family protein n=1 Tax=Enterococcus sp. HY326 TaxID=2971265 RepID=UPI00223F414A|nr:PrpF domain-containing protein [Enterococcus sp. HY326]
MEKLACSIYRGGTSKGVFLLKKDLEALAENQDQVLLEVMGSPDVRQIDGLGGAVSTTSKVAIISPEDQQDWDVNYTFAQVSIDKPFVSYSGNCGNISSAVGVFAIENGFIEPQHPVTTVKVFNTNTNKLIYEHIPTPDGKLSYEGDFKISGVPGTGLKIELEFINPAGSMTGKLLPTGKPVDLLSIPGFGQIEVSIVDAANPLVFVAAEKVNLKGNESAQEIDSDAALLDLLEKIRGAAAEKLGFVKKAELSAKESPGVPKLTIVSKPADYTTVSGEEIKKDSFDLAVRMMSMQKAHKTIALTGALCTTAACVIPNTIPNQLCNSSDKITHLTLGHGDGLIDTTIDYQEVANEINIKSISSFRTARKILSGTVYINN